MEQVVVETEAKAVQVVALERSNDEKAAELLAKIKASLSAGLAGYFEAGDHIANLRDMGWSFKRIEEQNQWNWRAAFLSQLETTSIIFGDEATRKAATEINASWFECYKLASKRKRTGTINNDTLIPDLQAQMMLTQKSKPPAPKPDANQSFIDKGLKATETKKDSNSKSMRRRFVYAGVIYKYALQIAIVRKRAESEEKKIRQLAFDKAAKVYQSYIFSHQDGNADLDRFIEMIPNKLTKAALMKMEAFSNDGPRRPTTYWGDGRPISPEDQAKHLREWEEARAAERKEKAKGDLAPVNLDIDNPLENLVAH